MPNTEVLAITKAHSLYSVMAKRRLRWLGHVSRMEDGRIPKDLLYGELERGKRRTGRPLLRFKDTCKRDMKVFKIDPNSWEMLARDRAAWRSALRSGESECEQNRRERWEKRRQRRHQR